MTPPAQKVEESRLYDSGRGDSDLPAERAIFSIFSSMAATMKLERVQGPSLRVWAERVMISSISSSSSEGMRTGTTGDPLAISSMNMGLPQLVQRAVRGGLALTNHFSPPLSSVN